MVSDSPAGSGSRPKRIVLTTFGSLGDLHPYFALALGLQARGHEVIIATSPFYRDKVTRAGIGFRPVRPELPDIHANPDLAHQLMDRRLGSQRIVRGVFMPVVRESYADTLAAADGADLLVSHPLTFTTRLVAEKKGIAWVSSMLAPLGFFSKYDPPVLPPAPFLSKLRSLGPTFNGAVLRLLKWTARRWSDPWRRLRADIGLPPTPQDPLFDGQHSPYLVLALFSNLLAAPQPDWPANTVVTGFPFYDQGGEVALLPELDRFLDEGPPPVVFTLGTSAVLDAGSFYEQSAAAARMLHRRAVLLVGPDPRNRPATLPDGVAAFEYAPYAALFPRAAAIVHQGGIGTTAEAMRAGRPMLVMPYAHDQPDNAERVARLGVARTIARERYTAARAADALRRLLDSPSYTHRAARVGEALRREDAVAAACTALETLLERQPKKP
jgi:UDP:flavonoid glycosyltransferase YjiC (YdhE family)